MLAAVDGDVGTGNEGGFFRAQVGHESGDFFRFAQAATGICGTIFESSTSFGMAITILVPM